MSRRGPAGQDLGADGGPGKEPAGQGPGPPTEPPTQHPGPGDAPGAGSAGRGPAPGRGPAGQNLGPGGGPGKEPAGQGPGPPKGSPTQPPGPGDAPGTGPAGQNLGPGREPAGQDPGADDAPGAGPAGQDLGTHPDRLRWNAKYERDLDTSFRPHPLARQALAMSLPAGPVADLACGPSGAALLAAAAGRRVVAVDVAEAGLRLLDAEARRRGLAGLITLVHADLRSWRPPPGRFALVLCTGYWDRAVFGSAAPAVAPGGLIAWEAYTAEARRTRPSLSPGWCLAPGEPASLLPHGFEVIGQHDSPEPGRDRRTLLARRLAAAPGT